MAPDEADRQFLGMTLTDMVPVIEHRLGRTVPPGWKQALMQRLVDALEREAEPVAGALDALAGVSALGLPWRVASNSSHEEMAVKFARIGILGRVAGRQHSFQDVTRGKPAPDIFLAAAAAEGVRPGECLVIEDSTTGMRAARAAGMDCLAYAPHGGDEAFRALGAVPFKPMQDLPRLLALAIRGTA
jgi:HAD superfamily hydrolase (TIGR01509 family)